MKFVQVVPPSRIEKKPKKIISLILDGNIFHNGFKIKHLELRYYPENIDASLGSYSLITCFLETDRGSIEMTYDEGYRGNDPIDGVVKFLLENLGLSGLILRSTIALDAELSNTNT